MKKTLIIAGIILILLVAAFWVYLLLFNPQDGEGGGFGSFGLSGNSAGDRGGFSSDNSFGDSAGTVDTATNANGSVEALKQLTTRPVAGAVFVGNSIRYVEQGTGHIYEIALSSGSESQISATTITETTYALFSDQGDRVAVYSDANGGTITVGTINRADGGGSLSGINLPAGSREIGWSASGTEIFYLDKAVDGSTAYAYNLDTKSSQPLFSVPLNDVEVLWGSDTYVYTTPTAEQTGYIYKIGNNTLDFVTAGKRGLMGIKWKNGLIVSHAENKSIVSSILENGGSYSLILGAVPDKCSVGNASSVNIAYCGAPISFPNGSYPDDWYKGLLSLTDVLWSIDLDSGEAAVLSDLSAESGREIDIATIGTNDDGTLVWFTNKNDGALWMFDTLATLQ